MQKLFGFLLKLIGLLALIAGVLRLTLFEPWTIPDESWLSVSVAPTLSGGDIVLLLTRGTPGFGDLVRCTDPDDKSRWVVGRIVGLSGDEVQVEGATLRVNGRSYDRSESCKVPHVNVKHPDSGNELQVSCSRVDMAGGWHYRGDYHQYRRRNDQNTRVGDSRVFLLSDNRNLHDDSRDFGTLPHASCTQRIVFRMWGETGWEDAEHRLSVIR